MAVTKTWDIAAMDSAPTEGSLSDVVKTIHWNCRGTETVGSGESAVTYDSYSYGCIGLADADASSFTDFASITKANAIAWAQAALGADEVTSIETALEAEVNAVITPTTGTGVPW